MNKLNLTCKPIFNGIMAYWEQVNDAAGYIVTLYVNDAPISIRNNPRTELYCSFVELAKLGAGYSVQVQAEDHSGQIIAESEKVKCSVVDLNDELAKMKSEMEDELNSLKTAIANIDADVI